MTNLDDSEQNTQKDDELTMVHEIRSAANGADRSDIMYLMDSKNEQQSIEDSKKQKVEDEVANFKVNSLNKKPTIAIAMKEKRHIAPTATVIIKKKRKKLISSSEESRAIVRKGGSDIPTVGPSNNNGIITDKNMNKNSDSIKSATPATTTIAAPVCSDTNSKKTDAALPKKSAGALGGLLGDYSDSDWMIYTIPVYREI